MKLTNIISELKRRNVFRVATAYAIAGWLLIQITDTVFPRLGLPDWTVTFVIALVFIGLPISMIIAWAFELTDEGIKKSKEVDITASVTAATGKKLNGLIIGVLGIAVVFLVIERVFFAEAAFIENQSELADTQAASIAVLPFVNMSGDEDNEYFSDGLSEELLNALAKVEDLKVAGRTSSFKFKGQNENLTLIGEELKVSHILEGSVRKSGNRIRITAQLIKVDDGYHVWSETFDRELTINNIFDIQEEISKTVMEVLKVKLLPEEEIAISTQPTADIEAYNAFLEASQLLISLQPEDTKKAIEKLKQAIRLDPSFAEAYARLAIAYSSLNQFGNFSYDEAKVLARENIDKALLIDGNLGRAYEAMGYYNLMTFDAKVALEAFERAAELLPNDPNVYDGMHLALERNERYPEANAALKKAYEQDPLNPSYASSYANHIVNSNGAYEEATRIFDKMFEVYPDYTLTYRYKAGMLAETPYGKLDEAFELLFEAYSKKPDDLVLMQALLNISRNLDFKPVAKFLVMKIGDLYPENDRNMWINASIAFDDQDYEKTEALLSEAIDIYGEQSRDDISNWLVRVYYLQGRYEEGIRLLEEEFPEFKEQPVNIKESNNGKIAIYSALLEKVGRQERALQLQQSFCDFNTKQIEESTTEREKTWQRWDQITCKVWDNDLDGAIDLFEELYFVHNSKSDIQSFFAGGIELKALENMPRFQDLKKRIMADLHAQRLNVINYLKAEGEWREEWETAE